MAKPRKTNRTRPAPRTAFKPGHKKVGGRKKGTPNRVTTDLKLALINALNRVGGEDYFVRTARVDRRAFLPLIAKLIPSEVKMEASMEVLAQKAKTGLTSLSDAELATLEKILAKIGLNPQAEVPAP